MSHAQSRPHAMLFMVLALVACDSGLVSTGIDGTGMAKGRDIVSVGRVWGLGSIEVNGVRFAMTGATFTVDGTAANPTDLNLGDIVVIEGTLNSGETSAVAQRVVADHVLQGSIDAMDTANGSLIALGQTVHVSTILFTAHHWQMALGVCPVGDRINVSGFRNLHGIILATRIDRQAVARRIQDHRRGNRSRDRRQASFDQRPRCGLRRRAVDAGKWPRDSCPWRFRGGERRGDSGHQDAGCNECPA